MLSSGCVLVDVRTAWYENLSVPCELKARSIMQPTIAIYAPGAAMADFVAAMKEGAIDYVAVKKRRLSDRSHEALGVQQFTWNRVRERCR